MNTDHNQADETATAAAHSQFDSKMSTRDLVVKYANEIKANGGEPTPTKILAMIFERAERRASPNLVTDELRRYRDQAGKLATNVLKLEGIDAQYRESAVSMLGELIKLSRNIAERDTAIYVAQADEKLQVMAKRVEEAEQRRDHDQELIKNATERITESKQVIADLQAQLVKADERAGQAESAVILLRDEIVTAHKDLDAMQREMMNRLELVRSESKETLALKNAELERQQEAHKVELQKMRDLVATQIEQLDAFRKAAALETDRQRQVYAQEVESLRNSLIYETAKLDAASKKINDLSADLNKEKTNTAKLESELKTEKANSQSLRALYDSLNAKVIAFMAQSRSSADSEMNLAIDPYPLIEASSLNNEYKQTLRVLVEEALEENEDSELPIFEKVQAIVRLATKNSARAIAVIDSLDKGEFTLLTISTRGW